MTKFASLFAAVVMLAPFAMTVLNQAALMVAKGETRVARGKGAEQSAPLLYSRNR